MLPTRLGLQTPAQLVGLRRGQDGGARDDGARRRRQARLLPRGSPPEEQVAERRLQARFHAWHGTYELGSDPNCVAAPQRLQEML